MIHEQLGIYAEQSVQPFLVDDGHPRDIAHRVDSVLCQLRRRARPHLPELGQRGVAPQQHPVGQFVQFGDSYAIRVRRRFLRHDVHGHFCEVQVRSDARRRRDPGVLQHIADHRHGQVVRRGRSRGFCGRSVEVHVVRSVDEHLVDAVDVNVLRRHVFQVDFVNLRGDLLVQCHLRRRDHIGDLAVVLCLVQPDGFLRLEQPWSGSDPHGL